MNRAHPLTGEQKEFLRDQPDQLLKLGEVLALLHTNRASFYRRHPLAKCRIKMGRSSFWSKSLVLEWIRKQQDEASSKINAA
jgi:predicted DNA-binding transcriptional regulator AlpA